MMAVAATFVAKMIPTTTKLRKKSPSAFSYYLALRPCSAKEMDPITLIMHSATKPWLKSCQKISVVANFLKFRCIEKGPRNAYFFLCR
jgi:hypothetical protein